MYVICRSYYEQVYCVDIYVSLIKMYKRGFMQTIIKIIHFSAHQTIFSIKLNSYYKNLENIYAYFLCLFMCNMALLARNSAALKNISAQFKISFNLAFNQIRKINFQSIKYDTKLELILTVITKNQKQKFLVFGIQ